MNEMVMYITALEQMNEKFGDVCSSAGTIVKANASQKKNTHWKSNFHSQTLFWAHNSPADGCSS